MRSLREWRGCKLAVHIGLNEQIKNILASRKSAFYGLRIIKAFRGEDRAGRNDGATAMSGSVNKVILIGNLGKDPEVRRLNSGEAVVSFSLATTERWRDKATGEQRDRTEWHDVVVFNENLAKVAENYLKKGSKVYVEGQLQTRSWQDQQSGQERKRTEIVLQRFRGELTLMDSRNRSDGDGGGMVEDRSGGQMSRAAPQERRAAAPAGRASTMDDDIPF